MESLVTALDLIGLAIVIIGWIWLLIESFSVSVLWGLGCLLLSPVQLIFLIVHWSEAKKPFFMQLSGLALIFVSVVVGQA
ncbi:hypothetical protein [Coraliomargarita parva]|uniref:hypothetical protein n=1 Tax=Coraliomargarita parva TaxID=3014050 RepID=UPI0022B47B2B|nr:hypothetical protein [Coraliomargarita parva]